MASLNGLYLNPDGKTMPDLSTEAEEITLLHAGSEPLLLDPQQVHLHVSVEHPPVDGMDGDWGAICEVYRQKNDYYVRLAGVRLEPGDVILVRYHRIPTPVMMQVIELENGRARIDPPVFDRPGRA